MTDSLMESWKTWALADAERRGLPGLKPVIEGLAASTTRLRATRWLPAPDEPDSAPAPHSPDSPHPPERAHGR